jgi:hypothetical protein
MFRVGDEVVCVDARGRPGCAWYGDVPIEWQVYTIRAVGISRLSGELGVWLNEIRNDGGGIDDAYRAIRFRKVQRRNTDLSVESFLTIKPGFEEPRRVTTPTRKRERA